MLWRSHVLLTMNNRMVMLDAWSRRWLHIRKSVQRGVRLGGRHGVTVALENILVCLIGLKTIVNNHVNTWWCLKRQIEAITKNNIIIHTKKNAK